ncbi:CHRD domain-containing protein [Streptomyces capitiformicae]|uniref:CHRD domain-containing protein n=1 Tax=Streptomyces capitiformicae TaxID=2014920 RepID=A0A918Z0X8_9ACTN|nr:CHRD domain-containing protein [Streptomyces capitiformicae]GHE32193.1 CHRD domain-containing protein [Streptomyces capitiformicae]
MGMRVLTAAAAAALATTAIVTSLAIPAGAATGDPAASGGEVGGRVSGDARLDGEQEVPGPGDPDGHGRFQYKIHHDTFCYKLSVSDIGHPTEAHLHIAPRGETGPVALALKTPSKYGKISDCVKAQEHQNPDNATAVLTHWELQAIKHDPFLFYVNIHNKEFPDGAIRGQLA